MIIQKKSLVKGVIVGFLKMAHIGWKYGKAGITSDTLSTYTKDETKLNRSKAEQRPALFYAVLATGVLYNQNESKKSYLQ